MRDALNHGCRVARTANSKAKKPAVLASDLTQNRNIFLCPLYPLSSIATGYLKSNPIPAFNKRILANDNRIKLSCVICKRLGVNVNVFVATNETTCGRDHPAVVVLLFNHLIGIFFGGRGAGQIKNTFLELANLARHPVAKEFQAPDMTTGTAWVSR